MKREHAEGIYARHKGLFSKGDVELECGDGWHDLIDECLSMIQAAPGGDECTIYQIKEKFGELRVYFYGPPSPQVSSIVRHAEELSHSTCMECGGPGKLVSTHGYVHCACPPCHETVKKRSER